MDMTVSGIDLRISRGNKFPDDLRMDAFLNGRWVPLQMELAFAMVDFFQENEREMAAYRGHWLVNGDTYFMRQLADAYKNGWQGPAQRIQRQRQRRESA